MAQLSYTRTMPIGFAGMKGDSSDDTVRSYANQEASAEIPFGALVVQGADQFGCKLPSASGDIPVGIALHSFDATMGPANAGYAPKAMVSVLSLGTALVTVEDAVTPSSPVYWRHTANGANTIKGSIRGSADTGCVQLKGAHFLYAAAAGALSEIKIDITANRAALA